MSPLVRLLRVSSFREAVSGLLALSSDGRREIREGRIPEGAPKMGDTAGLWLAAYDTLCKLRDDEGIEVLVSEAESALTEIPNVRQGMEELLYEDPASAERRIIADVERSALPILLRISIDSDLRAASLPLGRVKLVPVSIVRLEFDEPVCGSDALTFQLAPRQFDEVLSVVDAARAMRDQLISLLPEGIVVQGDANRGS